MNGTAYSIHGVGLEVRSDQAAVVDAMDLRLRDFGSGSDGDAELRLEFVLGDPPEPVSPPGPSRPVYDTPHGSLHYFPESDALCGQFGTVHLRCEASGGVARFSSAAFDGRALYFATHPLATISLMELLERRGLFSLHAACLASDAGRGVLLCGPSGSGKSTLTLALARAGMAFLSDDVVFVEAVGDGSAVRVRGFADAIGVTPFAAGLFEELRPTLEQPPADGFPKRLRRIEDLFGAPPVRDCEPHALVFPEVAADELSEIAPLDPGEALLRLVPDVLLTEASATRDHVAAIAALLGQVRCYALRSGSDLERAAELVRALVES